MRNFRHTLLIVTMLVLTGMTLSAQSIKVNKKPGAVSLEELQMTSYKMDSRAHAVYMVITENTDIQALTRENGYSGFGIQKQVQDYFSIVTKHFARLKVLDEAGLERAAFEFTLKKNKALPDIYRGLKVTTYNLVGGKIVATKMDKSAVSQTSLDDATDVVRCTAPDVKVGSVIEIQWETRMDGGLQMPQILMQRDIPVNYGEYVLQVPAPVYYTYNLGGVDAFLCERTLESKGTVNVERYVVCDMPAFDAEPLCDCPQKYMARATYTLKSITYGEVYEKNMYHSVNKPGRTVNFSESWEEIDKDLYGSDVTKSMQGECRFAARVDAIAANARSEEQLVADIRNMVLENVAWNGVIDIMPDASVVTGGAHRGSNADINALVASCLSRAGFVVCPVFLKLRSSGALSGIAAEQFDTFMIYAEKEGKYVFDAADPAAYINVIPQDMISDKLRFVNNTLEGQWLDLGTLSTNTETYTVQASLRKDAVLNVKVRIKCLGGKSYLFKKYYQSFASREQFVEAFAHRFVGYTVEACEIEGVDQWSGSAIVDLDLSRKLSMQEDGSLLVDPYVCKFADEDFLAQERRKLPFEFTTGEGLKYTFSLDLGDAYEAVKTPVSFGQYNKELGWMARQACTTLGKGKFSLLFTCDREKSYAPNTIFPQLKTFWTEVHNGMQVKVECKAAGGTAVSE